MLHKRFSRSLFLLFVIFLISFSGNVIAQAASVLVVTSGDITFSKQDPLEGETIRIYAKIANRGGDDQRGIVKFFDGKKQIGTDQPFTILRDKTSDVFTDYEKLPYGDRKITVKVVPWQATEEGTTATVSIFVDRDSDKDGIPDRKDSDDDNDGIEDTKDAFPFDPTEWQDTDKDGIGDNKDADDDNDGLSDEEEIIRGTDSKKWDTDGDKTNDKEDVFPLDAMEWADSDHDGIGNNKETDDDNDGVEDSKDAFPTDASEWQDTDGDKIGNNRDLDDDNDGLSDGKEKDIGTDPIHPDTDGDGVKDGEDIFPLDNHEWKDSDRDSMGDNSDPNNNNKGPVLMADIPLQLTLLLPYYFNALGTYDPDGKITKIAWNLDGTIIESRDFWYFFFTPGKHTLLLTAVDDKGESRVKTYQIDVSGILYVIVFGILLIVYPFWRFILHRLKNRFVSHQITPSVKRKSKKEREPRGGSGEVP